MSDSYTGRGLSVQAKINIALLSVFFVILAASLILTSANEKQLVQRVVEQQTLDMADGYFDSINTMMLTGTMAQRNVLRDKILERPGVTEARIVRTPAITSVYGPGYDHQAPVDALDQRALAGEQVIEVKQQNGKRLLTVINPVLAEKDYRGTNCLLCHQVAEGEVVGAVRISYSLEALDQQVQRNLLLTGVMQLGVLLAGLALMLYLLRRLVIRRIHGLRQAMEEITRDSDLGRRLQVDSQDELGQLGCTFNNMLGTFRQSLLAVSAATGRLHQVSGQVAGVADNTLQAVIRQRTETDMVASAMHEMSATVQEVASNAARTAQASLDADGEARGGVQVAENASQAIEALIGEISEASDVVARVEQGSLQISEVLAVIDEIASQTNLLALNAAIEAARAGEQGRGFAVVADEVRTLAVRTQRSTEDIQSMIQALQQAVTDAVTAMNAARSRASLSVEQVGNATNSLHSIARAVADISAMNMQIATAAEEQSAVAEEINRNVSTISDIADHTAQDADATRNSSSDLVGLADELQHQVARFRLGDS